MTWHTEIIPTDALSVALGTIRRAGGTVTGSRPCPSGCCVTYMTPDERSPVASDRG